MKKIKIAFIGAGNTMNEHLKVAKKGSDVPVELSGIFSRTKSKAKNLQKKYKINYLCNDIDELYEKTKADIVLVAVSVESFKKIAIKVSKFPWKILTEKPFGINLQENLQLKEILGKKRKKFYIGFNRIFYDNSIFVKKLIKRDKSQRILNVYDQQDISQFKKKITKDNLMFSNSIHIFSLFNYLVRGRYKKINEILKIENKNQKYFLKKIVFSSGDIVFLHSIWNKPGPWKLDLSNSNYFFCFDPLEKLKYKDRNSKKYIDYPESRDDINFKAGFKKQFNFFIKNFLKKNKSNFDESTELMKLINDYYFKKN
jgi:predicted dehydrogenase